MKLTLTTAPPPIRRWIAWLAATAVVLLSVTGFLATPAEAATEDATGVTTVTVKRIESTYVDGSTPGNAINFPASVWYPATAAGDDTPFMKGDKPYPIIGFLHGFGQFKPHFYGSVLEALTDAGFVVIAPLTQPAIRTDHLEFGLEVEDAIAYLKAQNTTDGSMFEGGLDTEHIGVTGHSMGGGASILAAADQRVTDIDAMLTMAAAQTFPLDSEEAATMVGIPHSFVVGTADRITPMATNVTPMYNAAAAAGNSPVQERVIQGGTHCGYESDIPTAFINVGCDTPADGINDAGPFWDEDAVPPAMTYAEQLPIVEQIVVDWFRFYLYDDASVCSQVWGVDAQQDPVVTFAAPEASIASANCPDGRSAPALPDSVPSDAGALTAPADVTAGESAAVSAPAGSFAPNSEVHLGLYSALFDLGVQTSAADGGLSATVQIPTGAPAGQHQILATGFASTATNDVANLAATVTVTAAPGEALTPPPTEGGQVPSGIPAGEGSGANGVGPWLPASIAAVLVAFASGLLHVRRRTGVRF